MWGNTLEDGLKMLTGTLQPGKKVYNDPLYPYTNLIYSLNFTLTRMMMGNEIIIIRLESILLVSFIQSLNMHPIKLHYNAKEIPANFDARNKWPNLSPILNQGWCGASWAFSTISVAQDR